MENAVFPISRLPFSVQQRVVCCLTNFYRICFSILSAKAKSIVKSLKGKLRVGALTIRHLVDLSLQFFNGENISLLIRYREAPHNSWYRQLKSVETTESVVELVALIWVEGPLNKIIKSQFTLRDWLLHFLSVYHESKIDCIEFSDQIVTYDLPSIITALRGIEVPMLSIQKMRDEEIFKMVIKTFPSKRLVIDLFYRPGDVDHLQRVLLSNFDYFRVDADKFPYFGSLDRFISINALTIVIDLTMMTGKSANKFLKLWIKGAMPRLKRLTMCFNPNTNAVKKDVIMNGIQFTEQEDEERSGIFEFYYGPESETVKGGLCIMRSDGVKATIKFDEEDDNVTDINFHVWDH